MEEDQVIKILGMDVPRIFANNAAIYVADDLVTIVFSEAASISSTATGEGEDEHTGRATKNVGSFVFPLSSAKRLARALQSEVLLGDEEEEEPK